MCNCRHSIAKDYLEAQELDSFNASLELSDNSTGKKTVMCTTLLSLLLLLLLFNKSAKDTP